MLPTADAKQDWEIMFTLKVFPSQQFELQVCFFPSSSFPVLLTTQSAHFRSSSIECVKNLVPVRGLVICFDIVSVPTCIQSTKNVVCKGLALNFTEQIIQSLKNIKSGQLVGRCTQRRKNCPHYERRSQLQ